MKSESDKAEQGKSKAVKAEPAKKLTPLEREDQLYARTMEKYQAKKEKAQAAKNEKLVANIDKQISKENARHEKRVKQLTDKAAAGAKTEAKKPSSSVPEEAQAKVPGKAHAPKAPATTTKP